MPWEKKVKLVLKAIGVATLALLAVLQSILAAMGEPKDSHANKCTCSECGEEE